MFSSAAAPHLSYAQQLQVIMLVVLSFGTFVLGLHHFIVQRFNTNIRATDVPVVATPVAPPPPTPSANGALPHDSGRALAADAGTAPALPKTRKAKLSLREALVFLTNSPQIRCLAVMALAQGLSSNLIEIAWKSYLHKLHPSPAAYSVRPGASGPVSLCRSRALRASCTQAFMGDVAMWTGIVTGTLMFASPLLFERWKWRGVAGATPAFMLWTGLPFFAGCILYALAHPGGGAGTFALRALVLAGALLQACHLCTVSSVFGAAAASASIVSWSQMQFHCGGGHARCTFLVGAVGK